MKVSPNKFYWLVLRVGDWEKKGRCNHLTIRKLLPQEREALGGGEGAPSHVARFFDFESYRQVVGTVREEDEDHIVFDMGEGKVYEFREFKG